MIIKKRGRRVRQRDMMDQSYPIYILTRSQGAYKRPVGTIQARFTFHFAVYENKVYFSDT